MKTVTILVFCLLFFNLKKAAAQKENYNWTSPSYLRIDFNSSPPTFHKSSLVGEGNVAVSGRKNGALKFYSNSVRVWNKFDNLMPNGTGLIGGGAGGATNPTCTQGTLVVPFLTDTNKFFLFSLQGMDPPAVTPGYLHYAIVDMSLDGGLGDLSTKNRYLSDSLCEAMTSAKSDHCTLWAIVHSRYKNTFEAFEVTDTGINVTPVISRLPEKMDYSVAFPAYPYTFSSMKMSPDYTKIVMWTAYYIYLLDFDRNTGVVSNPKVIDNETTLSLLSSNPVSNPCFSPDGKILYGVASGAVQGRGLYQFDITLPSGPGIMLSKTRVDSSSACLDVQRLNDKLYVSQWDNNLGCIKNPNVWGAGCNYDTAYAKYTRPVSALTLQNLVLYPDADAVYTNTDTILCNRTPTALYGRPEATSYKWNSGATTASITTGTPGKIWVESKMECTVYTDTFTISLPKDTVKTATKTILCKDDSVGLKGRLYVRTYLWNTGNKEAQIFVKTPGTYWVVSTISCNAFVDTFHVNYATGITATSSEISLCKGQSATLSGKPKAISYSWSTGDTDSTIIVSMPGKYWVSYETNCGLYADTFVVKIVADTIRSNIDTVLCKTGFFVLKGRPGAISYQWQDASTDSSFAGTAEGVYSVFSEMSCSKSYADTFHVSYSTVKAMLGNDTLLCKGQLLLLNAGMNKASYSWQNGSTDSVFLVREPGKYSVTVTLKNCTATDTIAVNFIEASPYIGTDTAICAGDTLILGADKGYDTYLWSDGSKEQKLSVDQPGNYWLEATSGPCIGRDTVGVAPKTLVVVLGNDTTACNGDKVLLQSNVIADRYLWQDGSTEKSFTALNDGRYFITATSGRCLGTDTVMVKFVRCDHCIATPNAFTPNGDQLNSSFHPLIFCPTKKYVFSIYNRYGENVFKSEDPSAQWNGLFNGKVCEIGVYYFYIKVTFDYPGAKEELIKGDISLIR